MPGPRCSLTLLRESRRKSWRQQHWGQGNGVRETKPRTKLSAPQALNTLLIHHYNWIKERCVRN